MTLKKKGNHLDSEYKYKEDTNKISQACETVSQNTIPVNFRFFFWEINDISLIDIEKDSFYIIERLLNEGDEKTLQWLFTTYGEEKIKEVVKESRRLTEKTAYCWKNYFKLKSEDMRCFGRYLNCEESKFLKR